MQSDFLPKRITQRGGLRSRVTLHGQTLPQTGDQGET